MKITVLGAGGFIGTNLVKKLSNIYENNLTLIDKNFENLIKHNILDESRVQMKIVDLIAKRDYDEILKGQDIVYHLLSTTVPTTSNGHIPQEISDNVELTSRLLESCVKCGVKRVIFLSSGGTVYGVENFCPLREENETYPINSYGMQKVMNEKLLYLYQYLYGLDYRIIRLANPFGPYQRPDGIQGAIAAFAYKALHDEVIKVYGDGSVIRDYIYIDDTIQAIINIANYEGKEKLFNVGSGVGTSILNLLEIIENILKVKLRISYLPGRNVDVPVNFLDISKYERIFGKLISISLEDGIRKTIDYMKSVL